MTGQPLPKHVKVLGIHFSPVSVAVYAGLGGAILALQAQDQDWEWFAPAYKFAVALVVLVMAADRSHGEPLGHHRLIQGLTLWSGVALAAGTLYYSALMFMVAVLWTDNMLVIQALVIGLLGLAWGAVGIPGTVREYRDWKASRDTRPDDAAGE